MFFYSEDTISVFDGVFGVSDVSYDLLPTSESSIWKGNENALEIYQLSINYKPFVMYCLSLRGLACNNNLGGVLLFHRSSYLENALFFA